MRYVLFALGYFLPLIAASAVSAFSLDVIEPTFGRSISFQSLAWMSLVATIIATVVFGVASWLARRRHTNFRCAVVGTSCAAFVITCLYGYGKLVGHVTAPIALLFVVVDAILSAVTAPRHGA